MADVSELKQNETLLNQVKELSSVESVEQLKSTTDINQLLQLSDLVKKVKWCAAEGVCEEGFVMRDETGSVVYRRFVTKEMCPLYLMTRLALDLYSKTKMDFTEVLPSVLIKKLSSFLYFLNSQCSVSFLNIEFS